MGLTVLQLNPFRKRSFGILMRIFIFIQCLKKDKATILSNSGRLFVEPEIFSSKIFSQPAF